MTDFVYFYLSPFAVGLLAFALCVIVGISICAIISKIYNWVIYDIPPVGRLRKTINRVVEWWNKWVIPVLVGAFCVFIVVVIAVGAWGLGNEILKRLAFRGG